MQEVNKVFETTKDKKALAFIKYSLKDNWPRKYNQIYLLNICGLSYSRRFWNIKSVNEFIERWIISRNELNDVDTKASHGGFASALGSKKQIKYK